MEKLVTLYYGNFAILGERVRKFAWRTGCSKRVTNLTLRGQLFLNELGHEHSGWNTTYKQQGGLFLLECILHIAASMRRKEHPSMVLPSTASGWSDGPWAPFIWTFSGSMDAELRKITKQVYRGDCIVAPSVLPSWQHEGAVPRTHQAYGQTHAGWAHCKRQEMLPQPFHITGLFLLS